MTLKLAWASFEACKFACLNFHYAKAVPAGKLAKIGVWEDQKFIGVIVFGMGANNNLSKSFGLKQSQCCELVRVALRDHKNTVSKIIAISIRMIKKKYPGIKIIVSYADPEQGHVGTIYQAGNWVYLGVTKPQKRVIVNGKKVHKRSVRAKYGTNSVTKIKEKYGLSLCLTENEIKHKYVYPLDESIGKMVRANAKKQPKKLEPNIITGY